MKTVRGLLLILSLLSPSALLAQTPAESAIPSETKPTSETKLSVEVKGYVLPVVAGIAAADLAAGALHELASTEPFQRKDARKTAELAEKAVAIAHERAEDLHKVKGLSADARTAAESATRKLKEARSTVERIQRQVGVIEGMFRKHEAEKVRDESKRLHTELTDARASIEKVASTYQISTRLEVRAEAATGGR